MKELFRIDEEEDQGVPEMLNAPEGGYPEVAESKPVFWDAPEATPDEDINNLPMDAYENDPALVNLIGMPMMAGDTSMTDRYAKQNAEFTFGEQLGAFMETENFVSSAYEKYKDQPIGANEDDITAIRQGWNAVESMKLMGIDDEAILSKFSDAEYPSDLEWKMANLKREKDNRYIMESMSIGESLGAGLITAVTDPLSWVMAAIPFVKGGMLARSAYGAAIASSEAAVAEVLLHSSQEERTLGESFMGVGATAIFGGVLGPLSGRLSKQEKFEFETARAERLIEEDMKIGDPFNDRGDLNSAKTYRIDPDVSLKLQNDLREKVRGGNMTQEQANDIISQEANNNTRVWLGSLMKPLGAMSPMLDISLSASITGRRAIEWMTDSALIKNKHFQGIKSKVSMDTQISRINGRIMAFTHNGIVEQYIKYAGGKRSLLGAEIRAKGSKKLSLQEFKEEITPTYENNHVYTGKHEDAREFLEEASKKRGEAFKEYESQLVDAGILRADNQKAIDKYHADVEEYGRVSDETDLELEHMEGIEEANINARLLIEDMDEQIGVLETKIANSKSDKMRAKHDKAIRKILTKRNKQADQMDSIGSYTPQKLGTVRAKNRKAKEALNDIGEAPDKSFKATLPFGAKLYMPRIFVATNVAKYEDEFVDAVVADWTRQAKSHIDEVESDAQKARYQRRVDEMTTEDGIKDLRIKARQIGREISGQAVPKLNIEYIGKTNVRKKHRSLKVSTSALRDINVGGKTIDFIERDIMAITRGHITAMTPELVMKKSGFDMDKVISGVESDYRTLIQDAESKGTKRGSYKANRLRSEETRIKKKLIGMYQLLNNDYKRPTDPTGALNQARLIFKQYNMMRMLGSMTISAMTDLGNFVTHVGLRQVAGSFRMLSKPYRTMTRAQSKKMGLVLELVTSSRLNALALSDDFGPNMGTTAKFMANRSREFSVLTAMNHWNAGLKEIAIISYMDDILATSLKITKAVDRRVSIDESGRWLDADGVVIKKPVSNKNMAKFAASGLDEDDFLGIATQFNRHGDTVNGVRTPNIDQWKEMIPDPSNPPTRIEGTNRFTPQGMMVDENSMMLNTGTNLLDVLKRQADMAIVTPGAGDMPLWMRTSVGGVIGQFKSFSFTAINRIMLPNLQRLAMKDPSAAVGMTMQFGLGMAVYQAKMYGMGREDEIDNSWRNLAGEAFMRSGYFGILADVNAISHKVSRGKASLQGAIGGGDVSRYYSRSFAGDLIGPSFSTMVDAGRMVGSLFSDDGYNRGDLSAFRRMMPYQNLYWIRRQLSQSEEYMAQKYGL